MKEMAKAIAAIEGAVEKIDDALDVLFQFNQIYDGIRSEVMPKVGSGKSAKHFSYTDAGKKAAKSYAMKTGKKMKTAK